MSADTASRDPWTGRARDDAIPKVTGQARYSADLRPADTHVDAPLHGAILRSPHPHARIRSIDVAAAQALPGVAAVITYLDVPGVAVEAEDEASMGRGPGVTILARELKHVGDEVAAVAAVDASTARAALSAISVDYEVLPYVLDGEAALEPDAAPVYADGNMAGEPIWAKRGDVDAGMGEADEIFRDVYRTQHTSGAPMEPRVALASWEGDQVTVWKSGRAVYTDQRTLSGMLEVPLEAVRVITPTMGGSYGNKDESRLSAIVAQLARRAGRPVRGQFTREEELLFGRLRHPAVVELEIGIKRDGSIKRGSRPHDDEYGRVCAGAECRAAQRTSGDLLVSMRQRVVRRSSRVDKQLRRRVVPGVGRAAGAIRAGGDDRHDRRADRDGPIGVPPAAGGRSGGTAGEA